MPKKDPQKLGIGKAIWCSLRGYGTDFYPRVQDGAGPIQTLTTKAIIEELGIAAGGWETIPADPKLDAAIGLARQSLDEVKAQTEYQDQKAGRLLTVATILSAVAGLLFQRFNDSYPLLATLRSPGCSKFLILLAYLPFLAFVLAVLFGALVTFHATRTRFKYDDDEANETDQEKEGEDSASDAEPKDKQAERPASDEEPKSRLFYTPILAARPRAWVKSFVETQKTGKVEALIVNSKLPQLYFRDLVGETYLVAAKTSDKIRFLVEAQRLFAWALVCLLLWLLMYLVASFVPSTKLDPKPTEVQIVSSPTPTAETAVNIVQRQPLNVVATVKVQPPAPERKTARNGKGGHP